MKILTTLLALALTACSGAGDVDDAIAKLCINSVVDGYKYHGGGTQKNYLAIVKVIDDKMLVGHKNGEAVSGHLCKVNEDNVEIQGVRLLRGVDTSGYKIRTYSIASGKRIMVRPFDYAEVIIDELNTTQTYSHLRLVKVWNYPDHLVDFIADGQAYESETGNYYPVQITVRYDKNMNKYTLRR